ncbi:MAG: hypothetical protein V3R93_05905 [Candidatus Hydrothermarchaeaceae archaeon]
MNKYGFLLAVAGLIPIRSGILLLQEKDCGCFLIDKATLYSHNVFFGVLSIAAGMALLIPGVLAYKEESGRRAKAWIFVFLLAGGIAGYSVGAVGHSPVPVEGDYDELTKSLTENGWVLFYANWCHACHEQFDLLGTSVKNLRMVDCDTIACPEFVMAYPTWARTGQDGSLEVKEGVQSLEDLQQMAG